MSNASPIAQVSDDLSVCEELLTRIFELYADIEKLAKELPDVSGDMKSAYAKVLLDKSWKACKMCHSFNQEMLARIGSFESKTREVYINTTTE
jgi:hypothetical protein